MTRSRNLALWLALALAIALPGSALAASSSSDTTETLTVANTVSMTAQATATYTSGDEDEANGPDYSADIVLTVLSSNNPSGVSVTATAENFDTAGGIFVNTNKRSAVLTEIDCASPGQSIPPYTCPTSPAPVADSGAPLVKAATLYNAGTFATEATVVPIASSTGPLANADLGITFIVDADEFPVGGTYTSAVHWTTSTNP